MPAKRKPGTKPANMKHPQPPPGIEVEERSRWGPQCQGVDVYRRMVTRSGRETRALLGERIDPAELETDAPLRERWGPGRFALLPRSASGRVAGAEILVTVPNEDGSLPPFSSEDPEPAQGAAASAEVNALLAQLRASQEALETARLEASKQQIEILREMLRQSREDRAADLQLFQSMPRGEGDGDAARELRRELQRARDEVWQMRLNNAKSGQEESTTQFLMEVAKSYMERGAQARPAVGVVTPVESAALPDAGVLASALAGDGELDDRSLLLLARAIRSGNAPPALRDVVLSWLSGAAAGSTGGAAS